jgi:hypothetical protein
VSVNFHLKNAMPKAGYRIELWGNRCSFFGIVKTVKTKLARCGGRDRLGHRAGGREPLLRDRTRANIPATSESGP